MKFSFRFFAVGLYVDACGTSRYATHPLLEQKDTWRHTDKHESHGCCSLLGNARVLDATKSPTKFGSPTKSINSDWHLLVRQLCGEAVDLLLSFGLPLRPEDRTDQDLGYVSLSDSALVLPPESRLRPPQVRPCAPIHLIVQLLEKYFWFVSVSSQ